MKKSNYLFFCLALIAGFSSCKVEEPSLGDPPTEADAAFTYSPSVDNENIIEFMAVNPDLRGTWTLGNGSSGTGSSITGTYPYAGTYTVTFTVFTKGGSASTSQNVDIANDDISLLDDPLFTFLTGGTDGPGSKTWVIDSITAGHFGVGPDPVSDLGDIPEYYSAGPLDKTSVGLYDDHYVFSLDAFKFDMLTEEDVYVHNGLAGDFPGSFENLGDYTAPYPDQLGETWSIEKGDDTILTVSGGSFIGFWTGYREYRILTLSDTALWLQYQHHEGGLLWYLRLIPEGFVSSGGGGGDPLTYSLPLDFEGEAPVFNVFGGSTYSVIDNPDPSGLNTSAKVAETVHGNEPWAGLFVDLTEALDFSSATQIKVKVWAPEAGPIRFKIENSSATSDFVEIDGNVTTPNVWEEVSVDFSGTASGIYDRLVLFPGWDVPFAGTFYLDDITQE